MPCGPIPCLNLASRKCTPAGIKDKIPAGGHIWKSQRERAPATLSGSKLHPSLAPLAFGRLAYLLLAFPWLGLVDSFLIRPSANIAILLRTTGRGVAGVLQGLVVWSLNLLGSKVAREQVFNGGCACIIASTLNAKLS